MRARPPPRRCDEENAPVALCRLLDSRFPQNRLADPSLTREDERYGPVIDSLEERLDRVESWSRPMTSVTMDLAPL